MATSQNKIYMPHGETNVTLTCQNRCVGCNHFIPIQKPWFCDPAVLERDLRMANEIIHFHVYNLVGGEPTLHPEIVELLKIVRASGITDRVEITSNGQACNRWTDEFYDELDDLIITPYKLNADQQRLIIIKCMEHNVHLEWHPVIFTDAAYKVPDIQRGAAYYQRCWYAANRNVIDEGYFYRCCIGRFIPSVLLGLPREDDAIALDGLTAEGLRAYLKQDKVPAACNVCGSNCGQRIEWRETTPDKWLDESIR